MSRKTQYLIAELFVNLVLPWLTYLWVQPRHGELNGLIASAIPPLLWSAAELLRRRRLDALSLLVLAGITLSGLGLAFGGSPRLLLVRESLASGLIGVAFLGSLLLTRPLLFHIVRAAAVRRDADAASDIEAWWNADDTPRRTRVITAAWGGGLILEALLRAWLAWHWPPARYLALSPFVSYGLLGLLMAWTFWYQRRHRRMITPTG